MSLAQPLKLGNNGLVKLSESDAESASTPLARSPTKQGAKGSSTDISSPHELTAFVENLLEQLDTKFDEMSSQILDRMDQMSLRVDALETSLQYLINGDMSVSPTSTPGAAGNMRKLS